MRIDLHDLYSRTRSLGIMFCFSGSVSQSVIEGIAETLRLRLEFEERDLSVNQKVFSILVEQMQNIVNYSADRVSEAERVEGELRAGILVVGQDNNEFFVLCGNTISKEDVEPTRGRLDALRGLDREQLKTLYRERRKAASSESRKGAGLGFIDMARKASRPLEYEFTPIDATHAFF